MITELLAGLAAATLERQGVADPDGRNSTLIGYLVVGQAEASVRLMLDHPGAWKPEELGAQLARITVPALDRLG
jgi:hypothetical protein